MYIGLIIYWYVGKYDVVFLNKQEHTCSHFPSVFQFRKIDKFCMIRYIPRIESYLYLNQNVYQFHITYMYITFHAHLSKNWGGGGCNWNSMSMHLYYYFYLLCKGFFIPVYYDNVDFCEIEPCFMPL